MLKLRDLRLENNLTQKDLGEKVNITSKSIWAYENSVAFPPIDVLIKLADFFGCSIDYLVGREDYFGNVTATAPSSDLSEDEKKVLNLFKRMPEARQRTVLDLLEGLSDDGAERDGEKRRA